MHLSEASATEVSKAFTRNAEAAAAAAAAASSAAASASAAFVKFTSGAITGQVGIFPHYMNQLIASQKRYQNHGHSCSTRCMRNDADDLCRVDLPCCVRVIVSIARIRWLPCPHFLLARSRQSEGRRTRLHSWRPTRPTSREDLAPRLRLHCQSEIRRGSDQSVLCSVIQKRSR